MLLSWDFEGTKRHSEALARQINGSYQGMATALTLPVVAHARLSGDALEILSEADISLNER